MKKLYSTILNYGTFFHRCIFQIFLFSRSEFISLLSIDYEMEPTLEHYVRWGKYRAPGKNPKTFYEAKRSIHLHFYTNSNAELLTYAVEKLGFSWFNIRRTANHKDFYFVLVKA